MIANRGTAIQVDVENIEAKAKIWKRFTGFCAFSKKRISESAIETSWKSAVA